MNFLIHNMCRLPDSNGNWMIVKGGMGTVTKTLAAKAEKLGVKIILNKGVKNFIIENNQIVGIQFQVTR
jgi:phytoene dehydrogenase-like protein